MKHLRAAIAEGDADIAAGRVTQIDNAEDYAADLAGSKAKSPHRGSSLNDFLEDQGMREDCENIAIHKVCEWQNKQGEK